MSEIENISSHIINKLANILMKIYIYLISNVFIVEIDMLIKLQNHTGAERFSIIQY